MTLHALARLLHRWVGLAIAGFLVLAGLTGAIIAWDHELDLLLNRDLLTAKSSGARLPAVDLKAMVEARDHRREVTYLPLATEPGMALAMYVEPRLDAATQTYPKLGYNQVFVDPATGEELGAREWGAAWPITRTTAISFLYRLHSTLHLPEAFGIGDWGRWLMGSVALLWAMDCFVGLYLTLPARLTRPVPLAAPPAPRSFWSRWARSWRINFGGTPARWIFDFHRAASLWLWLFLFLLAFSGMALSLQREVVMPVLSRIASVTPKPEAANPPVGGGDTAPSVLPFHTAIAIASAQAQRLGYGDPPGAVGYLRAEGLYRVWFFAAGGEHGTAGFEPPSVYLDARDGSVRGAAAPLRGTGADIFLQAQLPIHSGRVLGLAGRILVTVLGLATAAITIAGVLVWYRRSRKRTASRAISAALDPH